MSARARNRRWLSAVLLALPSWAAAQGGAPVLPARLGDTARRSIAALGDSLRAEGLPWKLVYDKAREGVLKGAGDAQIVTAARSVAGRLRVAGDILGPGAAAAELSAAVSALYAGVAPDALRATARLRGSERKDLSLVLPFTMLADLVSRGIAPSEATSWIDVLLERGAREGDFDTLRSSLDAEMLGGRSPQDAARDGIERTLKTLDRRRPPLDPRER